MEQNTWNRSFRGLGTDPATQDKVAGCDTAFLAQSGSVAVGGVITVAISYLLGHIVGKLIKK